MEYNLLICISSRMMMVLDINSVDRIDRISVDGNSSMEIAGENTIEYFCGQVRDYYNIENFSELNMNVCVISLEAEKNDICLLFAHIKDAVKVNIIDAKRLFPLIVLKENTVQANRV